MWLGRRSEWTLAETWLAERNETRRLRPGREGLEVRALAGVLLVTQAGDLEDHVLEPGDALRITGTDLAVAWALEPSQVMLSRPRTPAAPEPPRRAA